MEQEETKPVETKPGTKTTEFWQSIIVGAIALLVMAFGMWKGSDGVVGFGSILMGMSQGAYSVSRGLAKQKKKEATP